MNLKLGKRPVRRDRRTLQFLRYATALPTPPPACDWTPQQPVGVMLNDQLGDCVVAGYAHAIEVWTEYDAPDGRFTVPDESIERTYFLMTGGADDGLVMLDALKEWRKEGLAGHKIEAFASIAPDDATSVKNCIHLFGGLYGGFGLTTGDMAAFEDSRDWENPKGDLIGGHCVQVVNYTKDYLVCVTWGKLQRMTWDWFTARCDEGYAMLPKMDWTGPDGVSPDAFDFDTLKADLAML